MIRRFLRWFFNDDKFQQKYWERFMLPRIKQAEEDGIPEETLERMIAEAYEYALPPHALPALLFQDRVASWHMQQKKLGTDNDIDKG